MSTSTSAAPIPTRSASSIPLDIARKTAPILSGLLVNWVLYGVLCVQTYVYSYNFPNDRRIVKCLAYFTFLFETAQIAMNGADVYYWFMEGFGNVERLKSPHLGPIDVPISHSVMSFVVQQYFCYRIWTLDRRLLMLCIVISMLSVLQSFMSVWGGIKSLILRRFIVSRLNLYLWIIPSALADFLIVIAMIFLLSRQRTNGTRFTNFIMIRVVRLTIETNALTAGVAITCLILAVAFPHDIYFVFAGEIIGTIYSNTLLVSLNNRICFRDHPRRGHVTVDSDQFVARRQSHRTAMTSLQFDQVQVGLPAHTATMGENLQLDTIPHAIDLGKAECDVSSLRSEPSSA